MSDQPRLDLLTRLFDLLEAYQGEGVFNQYRDYDPALDRPDGPAIRRQNLLHYLSVFSGARYLLIGEAAGYAGCRFSGIPFTGEAQIVGPGRLPWAHSLELRQSSTGGPWRERSGQIVWEAFRGRRDCVLWNTFPWHPHGDDPLSNRRPRSSELRECTQVLGYAISLFPHARICAIGRVSEGKLKDIGIEATYIRHPSHGGKRAFTEGVTALPRTDRGESDV